MRYVLYDDECYVRKMKQGKVRRDCVGRGLCYFKSNGHRRPHGLDGVQWRPEAGPCVYLGVAPS